MERDAGKYVGGFDTDEFITLDTFFADKNVTVVKADIEGAEVDMLCGGEKTFRRKIKQAYICTYHKWDGEQNIKRILKEYGFSTEFNKRYMMVHYRPKDFRKNILRRGVIRGTK